MSQSFCHRAVPMEAWVLSSARSASASSSSPRLLLSMMASPPVLGCR